MALRNVPYANQTSPTMDELDQTFADVAALGVIPCTATGTNAYVLTGGSNTPTVSAYYNHLMVVFVAPATSNGAVTIQPFGLSAVPLYVAGSQTIQAGAGDIVSGNVYVLVYNTTLGGFTVVSGPPLLQAATTAQARAVTDSSSVMTPANMIFHPGTIAAAATVISGGVVQSGHNFSVTKTGLGTYTCNFTSAKPQATTYQAFAIANSGGFFGIAAVFTSGFSLNTLNTAGAAFDFATVYIMATGQW